MLFNSLEFVLFLPLVLLAYWKLFRGHVARNAILLFSSYIFYGWWDWRFLSLIIFSSLVDYSVGWFLGEMKDGFGRKALFGLSLAVNLGLLGFFKYYNFFAESLMEAFGGVGIPLNQWSLQIILPVGISFYTFQTLSYTIDIYRKRIQPTKDALAFFAFVSFFPQLVAGPIERASNLLPQFLTGRKYSPEKAKDGLKQILWGLFKKIVIADNCAVIVNEVFEVKEYSDLSWIVLGFGAICFAFQIYGDFSGYSDIAIGVAKLFGFDLMRNFSTPYFAKDIGDFWRRWHISLSTWFRDYVYIPLGGSFGKMGNRIRNILITFVVSGLWHGANWTFVAWGMIHGLLYIPLMLMQRNGGTKRDQDQDSMIPSMADIFKMLGTFGLTTVAWIFFRSETIEKAGEYLTGIFTLSEGTGDGMHDFLFPEGYAVIFLLALFIPFEWWGRRWQHGLSLEGVGKTGRVVVYYFVILLMIMFGVFYENKEFIYFQF